MAWATVPVTGGIGNDLVLKVHFDEVRAAIVERCTAAGVAVGALPTAAADGCQPVATRAAYRAKIDQLIPYFCNPDAAFISYTKAACLTKFLGAGHVDWVVNPDTNMRQEELNEMRLVLNGLVWTRHQMLPFSEAFTDIGLWFCYGDSAISWDLAWTAAKAAYAAAAFVGGASLYFVSFLTGSYIPPPWANPFNKTIERERSPDCAWVVPNIDVLATKIALTAFLVTDENFDVDIFEQANFAGVPILAAVPAAPLGVDIPIITDVTPVVKNTTAHYSFRPNPEEPVPDLDAIRPADAGGAVRGFLLERGPGGLGPDIIINYDFAYKT